MVMKKSNQLKKKILAIFLTVLMIATTIPLNVFAASNMNLGEKDNNSTIDVKKETHPTEAGAYIAELIQKMLEQRTSGLNLKI